MTEPAAEPTQEPATEPTTDDLVAQQLLAAAVDPPGEPTGVGLPDDVDALKAEIAKLRRENASKRTGAKQQAAKEAKAELAQSIGKAIGLVADDQPVDPAVLTEQLTAQTAKTRSLETRLAVYDQAAKVNADATALLNRVDFVSKLDAIDPTDHLAIAAAIGEAVTSDPSLAKSRLPAPVPSLGAAVTPDESPEARIAAAQAAGDHATVRAIKAERLLEIRQNNPV